MAGWSVGVEHELLLVGDDALPVRHEESQALLELLARQGIPHAVDTAEYGRMTVAVDLPGNEWGPTVVKFDHHPHLLEIAFPPVASLHALYEIVARRLEEVHVAIESVGVSVGGPVLRGDARTDRFCSKLPEFVALRHYRRVILSAAGRDPTDDAANYSSLIAATQTHVGGARWWAEPHLLERAYALEASLWPVAFSTLDVTPEERWSRYLRVFEPFPLCGWCGGVDLSLEGYCSLLAKSPLAGGPEDAWAGSTLEGLGGPPLGSWDLFFSAVRDFPLVRPRRFGTLEYRSDPAQPSAERIVAVAALRLAQTMVAADLSAAVEASTDTPWLDAVRAHDSAPAANASILVRFARILDQRGLDEGRLLAPLVHSNRSGRLA